MKKSILFIVPFMILSLFSNSSFALGPVDGEVGVALWANDFDADVGEGNIDAGALMIHGETWIGDKWGIRGSWFDSDLEGEAFSDQSRLSLVLRRRLVSISDNNFIALGGGGEHIELENGNSSNGIRVSLEGRFGLPGSVFLFGRAAWIPILEDAGNFEDISATEIDAGIHLTPIPFVSLRAGYLKYELDYDDTISLLTGSKTSGFYIGAGFHW